MCITYLGALALQVYKKMFPASEFANPYLEALLFIFKDNALCLPASSVLSVAITAMA